MRTRYYFVILILMFFMQDCFTKNNKDSINFGDFILIYQTLGSKLNFLNSKCSYSGKTQVSKNCFLNSDFRNCWRIVNPDKLTNKKAIYYGDEVMLYLISPESKTFFLYCEKNLEFNNQDAHFYVKEKGTFSLEDKNKKWGRFRIVNPFFSKSRKKLDVENPIIFEYLGCDLVGEKKYLSSTSVLTDTPEVWLLRPVIDEII